MAGCHQRKCVPTFLFSLHLATTSQRATCHFFCFSHMLASHKSAVQPHICPCPLAPVCCNWIHKAHMVHGLSHLALIILLQMGGPMFKHLLHAATIHLGEQIANSSVSATGQLDTGQQRPQHPQVGILFLLTLCVPFVE